MKNIYIVVSQTNSVVSRLLRHVTGDKYNHVSISFDENLSAMYSFGRIFAITPIFGGFVRESPAYGTMKKFIKTADIVILKLAVEEDTYLKINQHIAKMYSERRKYHYNYIGLLLAKTGFYFHREKYFYCSEFVKDVLERFDVVGKDDFAQIVRPMELLNIPGGKIIYQGKLLTYAGT